MISSWVIDKITVYLYVIIISILIHIDNFNLQHLFAVYTLQTAYTFDNMQIVLSTGTEY